jgi:hypothetical protein
MNDKVSIRRCRRGILYVVLGGCPCPVYAATLWKTGSNGGFLFMVDEKRHFSCGLFELKENAVLQGWRCFSEEKHEKRFTLS